MGNTKNRALEHVDPMINDDYVVFIPPEEIKVIERALNDWQVVKQLWDHIKNHINYEKNDLLHLNPAIRYGVK